MSVVISGTDNFILNADALGTATAGAFDYDGKVFYVTPQGTERGVVPGAQFFRLNSALVGANVNTAQNLFGVGVTLSASTVYAFEAVTAISKSAGNTAHTIGYGFGGTATINNIMWQWHGYDGTTAISQNTSQNSGYAVAATNTVINARANTATTIHMWAIVRGTVSVNAGGTFIPQYTLSAAPGGAYSTVAGSYFMIYPIGASGANVNVGTWA